MDVWSYYATYTTVLAVVGVGVGLVAVAFLAARLLRPAPPGRPGTEKYLPYESGMDPVGEGWAQQHIRYYVFAYLYVVFAVDALYLFPWATVFVEFGAVTLVEMFVFLGFIAVGLVYAWHKGVLTWS